MALPHKTLISVVALVALAGISFYALTLGEDPIILLETPRNVLRIEVAGIYTDIRPEMVISVNGQNIRKLAIDSQQRKMFVINVPNRIDHISDIMVKISNQSHCEYEETLCESRKIIFRGLYLNDKKREDGEPSGEKNTPSLLETSDGGIIWHIDE